MMAVKDAEEVWGVSKDVVRDRARIIPGAYKEKGRWFIPDVDLPPITANGAKTLLMFLKVENEGGRPLYSKAGLRTCDVEDGFKYLRDCGYITGRPGIITEFGQTLLSELSAKEKTKKSIQFGTNSLRMSIEKESIT